jgi:hypothetical protein
MGIRILPHTRLVDMAREQGVIRDGQTFLDSIYYISPDVDRAWLERTLEDGFRDVRHIVFPPDALDSTLSFLHKMGYSGSMYDLFVKRGQMRRRTRGASRPA